MSNSTRRFARSAAFVACAIGIALHRPDGATTARAQSCEYRVSPVRVDVGGGGRSGLIAVDTQEGCAWTVSVDVPWIQLDATGGTKPGSFLYTVPALAANAEFPIRQAMIRVRWNTPTAGQNVRVTQIAAPCRARFLPAHRAAPSHTFGPEGGVGSLWTLAEPPSTGQWFVWAATAGTDWMTFSPTLEVFGTGDAGATFTVAPNPSTTPRSVEILFCNHERMAVYQAGRSLRDGPYVPGDFDDDGIADLAVYRPSNGVWFILRSSSRYSYADYRILRVGIQSDTPLVGDFDGDKKTEATAYRPQGLFGAATAGNWHVKYSASTYETQTLYAFQTVAGYSPEDIPLVADFSGDGKSDYIVYRKSTGNWYMQSTDNRAPFVGPMSVIQWGLPGDIPIPQDFDGDRRADAVVWRPSDGTWYVMYASGGYTYGGSRAIQWGGPGDIPVAGDFDGDGQADPAVWRPSEGRWYMRFSSTNYATWRVHQWGEAGDVPVPNDYDGDGRTDLAVWRPSTGIWYLLFSSSNYNYANYHAQEWGATGDRPMSR